MSTSLLRKTATFEEVVILDKDTLWSYIDPSELPKVYKDFDLGGLGWVGFSHLLIGSVRSFGPVVNWPERIGEPQCHLNSSELEKIGVCVNPLLGTLSAHEEVICSWHFLAGWCQNCFRAAAIALGQIPLLKFHPILQKVLYFVQDLPAAQQSDALRLALLAKYGGVWALDFV